MDNPFQFSLFGDLFSPPSEVKKKEPSHHRPVEPPASQPKPKKGDFSLLPPIAYRLKRAKRRSIGFYITENGLEVVAPRWVSTAEIETALEEKRRWIEKKLDEHKKWKAQNGFDAVSFKDDGAIVYRGRRVRLAVGGVAQTLLMGEEGNETLYIALPLSAEESRIQETVQSWLFSEAKRVIGERYNLISSRVGVAATSWRVSGAHAQWGSCSADGSIRFSWRLIYFDNTVIDYVIAHELAHRLHMDHSDDFWKTVASFCPDYVQARAQLKGILMGELPL